jgi:hypothetical protein
MIKRLTILVALAVLGISAAGAQLTVPYGTSSDAGKYYGWNGARVTLSRLPVDSLRNRAWVTGNKIYIPGSKYYLRTLVAGTNVTMSTTDSTLTINASGGVGSGITTLNTLTATTQTLAIGSTGTDAAWSSATSTHTLNLPTASGTNRGLLSTADWTTFNGKAPLNSPTFTGTVNAGTTFLTDNSAIRTTTLSLLNNYGTSSDLVQSLLALGRTSGQLWGAVAGTQYAAGTYSGGALKFLTETSDALGLQTKATIIPDGNFGVGDTTPAYDFTVGDGDLAGFDAGDGYVSTRIQYKVANAYTGAAYAILGVNAGANKKWSLYDYNGGRSAFEVDLATRTFTTFGPIVANGQTYTFPATQGDVGTTLQNNGSGTLTWGNENSAAGKYFELYDEFVSANGTGNSGAIAYLGTAATVTQTYSAASMDSNRWGVNMITTGTAAGSGAGFGWGSDNLAVGGGAIVWEADLRINRRYPAGGTSTHAAGTHAGDDWIAVVGLTDNLSVTGTTQPGLLPTDGIYFFAHTDSNQGSGTWKWSVGSARNAGRLHKWGTTFGAAKTVDTVAYHRFRIETTSTGDILSFYYDGTLIDTIKNWTFIPTAVARATGANFKFNKFQAQASAPTANTMSIDRVYVRKTFNPTR